MARPPANTHFTGPPGRSVQHTTRPGHAFVYFMHAYRDAPPAPVPVFGSHLRPPSMIPDPRGSNPVRLEGSPFVYYADRRPDEGIPLMNLPHASVSNPQPTLLSDLHDTLENRPWFV